RYLELSGFKKFIKSMQAPIHICHIPLLHNTTSDHLVELCQRDKGCQRPIYPFHTIMFWLYGSFQNSSSDYDGCKTRACSVQLWFSSVKRVLEKPRSTTVHTTLVLTLSPHPHLSPSPSGANPCHGCSEVGSVTIEGPLRRKTLLKEGRKPKLSSWTRFWITLSGSTLTFYGAKALRASERKHYKSSACKKVCVTGWMVVLPDDPARPNIFHLNDPDKG
ncbi:unnamed protein product, partial [Oncorhynchus mykiss]